MEEKDRKPEERYVHTKLTWEAPKLYALDKGKTKGGVVPDTAEDTMIDTIYPFETFIDSITLILPEP